MFNGVGIFGGIPGAVSISAFDTIAAIIYPWFMVLLFVIAGISARYSLQKRGGRQFIKERTVKLVIPSTLGLFVIHWITGYLNIKMGGGLAYIPAAFVYPVSVISGIGPLWFIHTLFVFSCILVLLRKLDKTDKVWTLCGKVTPVIIILLFVLIFGAAQILNMPVLTMYRFGIYFVSFLIGYYIFSHDDVQEAIEKIRIPMLCLAVTSGILYTVYYYGTDYTSPECLQSILTNLYLWMAVLAIFGYAKKYFNRETGFTRYMTKLSFGVYILHYPVLISTCYILYNCFNLPVIWNYLIALVVEIIMTFAVYEGIKKIPIVRYLVLGMRK